MLKRLLLSFAIFSLGYTFMLAQEFAGSESCKNCHPNAYTHWKQSGHPYKIQKLDGTNGPTYPVLSAEKKIGSQINYVLESGVPHPPEGLNWSDIGFVLGGYWSNARFLDLEGYLIWGPKRQYNLATKRWVQYTQAEPGKTTYSYNCYRCHTTGPSRDKTPEFEAYPGIQGSWAEAGIGCEGCHGPSKSHVSSPSSKPTTNRDCLPCHARDRDFETTTYTWNKRVEWQPRTVNEVPTGFVRHREQGDMLLASKHGAMGFDCATCHDAHKGVYFNIGGIKPSASCENCHTNKHITGHEFSKTNASCIDCHMPKGARNGDQLGPYVSEQSLHFFKILTDPITMFDNLEDISNTATPPKTYKFIKVDDKGMSGSTLEYSCLQCHTTKDVQWASTHAKGIHTNGITHVNNASGIPSAYTMSQNYPNPFTSSTTIKFALPSASNVTLNVYNAQGSLVSVIVNNVWMNSGYHEVTYNAKGLPSGVYIYSIQAENFGFSRKMILNL
ncbi:MAG: T9SS type A sorting domain-containing protein [Candidatus Kapabacteria bacterium]|nr:T9SS type A sorting domain-containing protein [Candidatus Kapabacteria bacterium]